METLITETVALVFFVSDANEAPQGTIAILFARYVKEFRYQFVYTASDLLKA